jgi:acyl dehydratase
MSARSTYPKALLRLVPIVGGARAADDLPDDVLERHAVAVDRDHLTAYQRVCGFRVSDRLPATYPHVIAFPLGMDLMTRLSFPFGAIGLVHVANEVRVLRPLTAADPFDLSVRTARLRPHERGRQFDVIAEASVAGEPVWHSTSTYLHREGSSRGSSSSKERSDPHDLSGEGSALWKVPGDVGRRYAAVSGDANPIHLHPLSARLFGFPTAIAHGMWVKARALAALTGRLPEALSVDVGFQKPLFLPSTVTLATAEAGGGWGRRRPQRHERHRAPGRHHPPVVVRPLRGPTVAPRAAAPAPSGVPERGSAAPARLPVAGVLPPPCPAGGARRPARCP